MCGGGRGRAELNVCAIKRSRGPHQTGTRSGRCHTPARAKYSSVLLTTVCLRVHVCVCSSSLETGGSRLAGCNSSMFGRAPENEAGERAASVGAEQIDNQTDRRRGTGKKRQECC